jgi:hypothetical protein
MLDMPDVFPQMPRNKTVLMKNERKKIYERLGYFNYIPVIIYIYKSLI